MTVRGDSEQAVAEVCEQLTHAAKAAADSDAMRRALERKQEAVKQSKRVLQRQEVCATVHAGRARHERECEAKAAAEVTTLQATCSRPQHVRKRLMERMPAATYLTESVVKESTIGVAKGLMRYAQDVLMAVAQRQTSTEEARYLDACREFENVCRKIDEHGAAVVAATETTLCAQEKQQLMARKEVLREQMGTLVEAVADHDTRRISDLRKEKERLEKVLDDGAVARRKAIKLHHGAKSHETFMRVIGDANWRGHVTDAKSLAAVEAELVALGASLEGDSDFMAVTDAAMRAKERAIAAHNDMVESNRAARDAARARRRPNRTWNRAKRSECA